MDEGSEEISLPASAIRLGMNWRQTFDALLSGRLTGRQLPNGRWVVTVTSVTALSRELSARRESADHAAA